MGILKLTEVAISFSIPTTLVDDAIAAVCDTGTAIAVTRTKTVAVAIAVARTYSIHSAIGGTSPAAHLDCTKNQLSVLDCGDEKCCLVHSHYLLLVATSCPPPPCYLLFTCKRAKTELENPGKFQTAFQSILPSFQSYYITIGQFQRS